MNFHFRPYTDDDGNDKNPLYVHQEKWQTELLARYRSSIVLIDATYKTIKYELLLFFITVNANVGYTAFG